MSSSEDSDPFRILGIEPRFDLEPRELRGQWMRRAAAVHPDSAGAADESARVNEAYRRLIDPRNRAVELMAVRQAPPVDVRALPEGFLAEMMELREVADGARQDPTVAGSLRQRAQEATAEALGRIGAAFARGDRGPLAPADAQEIWMQVNVLRAFERMLEQLDREGLGT